MLLRIAGWLPRDDWLVIGWALAIKVLLLALGAASYQAFEEEDVPLGRSWLEIWNQWDSIHFLRLAEFGYSTADKFKAWFYPFYPWCVRAFSYISGDFLTRFLRRIRDRPVIRRCHFATSHCRRVE